MAENRLSREVENREKASRPKQWKRADVLPEVDPMPGYVPRWVRISSLGKADPKNISAKLREGWEPVRVEEQPNLMFMRDENTAEFDLQSDASVTQMIELLTKVANGEKTKSEVSGIGEMVAPRAVRSV